MPIDMRSSLRMSELQIKLIDAVLINPEIDNLAKVMDMPKRIVMYNLDKIYAKLHITGRSKKSKLINKYLANRRVVYDSLSEHSIQLVDALIKNPETEACQKFLGLTKDGVNARMLVAAKQLGIVDTLYKEKILITVRPSHVYEKPKNNPCSKIYNCPKYPLCNFKKCEDYDGNILPD